MSRKIQRNLFSSFLFLSVLPAQTFAQDAACTTVTDCAQKAMEAAYQAKLSVKLAVPTGAIMAFNLENCPDGWADFLPTSGRFILGAGSGNRDQNDKHLTERAVHQTGGEEDHVLTVPELAKHTHRYTFTDHYNTPLHVDYSNWEFGNSNTKDETTEAGENVAHNNMPPFIVLKYCERR